MQDRAGIRPVPELRELVPEGECRQDLGVALRRSGDDASTVSRLEIFYFTGKLRTSISFDRIHKRYSGVAQRMTTDAVRRVLSEVKFRQKGNDSFFIWYNNRVDREIVERVAFELAGNDSVLIRLADTLVAVGLIKGQDSRPG